MTTKDEALKQALEALETLDGLDTETECVTIDVGAEITALRAALAQKDEQEPVAWMLECPTMTGDTGWILSWSRIGAGLCDRLQGEEHEKPLYTAPLKRKPLTDEQIMDCCGTPAAIPGTYVYAVARAIEAAHGIGSEHDAQP